MSVEAVIEEIEAKISTLSGLPPDLSEQYDKLRAEFAKKQKVSVSTESGTASTAKAKVKTK